MVSRAVPVLEPSDVAAARRAAVAVAAGLGFDEEERGRVAIAATELATNLLRHASGGEVLVGTFDDRAAGGVECLALDRGPGMGDVEAAGRDGHSTVGGAGTGLGAIRRAAHGVATYSRPGLGTATVVRLRRGRPDAASAAPERASGAVCRPLPGEEACGDAWCEHERGGRRVLMVADGLGHGPSAAEAAHAAVRAFTRAPDEPPAAVLERLHLALQGTRGAAVAVVELDPVAGVATFAGVGNVAGAVIAPDGTARRAVSHNGTVGHAVKRFQSFAYPLEPGGLVVLASDGLSASFDLAAYPGLALADPTLVAGVLYRDFGRARDDATVLAARARAP